MFGRHEKIIKQLFEVSDKFRQKGAANLENTLTIEELSFQLDLQKLMERRLSKLGIFEEVDGKYYRSEEQLKKVKEKRASKRRLRTLRLSR